MKRDGAWAELLHVREFAVKGHGMNSITDNNGSPPTLELNDLHGVNINGASSSS